MSWYQTQLSLWKAEVEKDDQNAEAWYNYYGAVRALRNLEEDKEKRHEYYELGHKVVADAYAAIPNTFEGNHLMHWDQGTGVADPKYLKKAYEINPNDPRIFDDVLIQAELQREKREVS